MSMLQIQRPRKAVYLRGEIACHKCMAPIHVYKIKTLPEEFSVRCSKCGDRGIYRKSAVVAQELRERRKKPRK
jgi:hypothetical protein